MSGRESEQGPQGPQSSKGRNTALLRQPRQLAEMLERFDPTALARIEHELQAVETPGDSNRKADTAPLF